MKKRQANRIAEPLKRMQAYNWAAILAGLGARPPTIEALLPYLPASTIKDLWAEVRGERSRKGPTPYTMHSHLLTPMRRLQSTFVLLSFLAYRKTGVHDIEAMVATYERFCHLFGPQQERRGFTFDQLYLLIRNYLNDRIITLEMCPGCGHIHVHNPSELLLARDCPLRRLVPNLNEIYRQPEQSAGRTQTLATVGDLGLLEEPVPLNVRGQRGRRRPHQWN